VAARSSGSATARANLSAKLPASIREIRHSRGSEKPKNGERRSAASAISWRGSVSAESSARTSATSGLWKNPRPPCT
jgi:hypothetical protein